jgi:hypothetical protein
MDELPQAFTYVARRRSGASKKGRSTLRLWPIALCNHLLASPYIKVAYPALVPLDRRA